MTDPKKICPNCQGNGFVKTRKSENPANDVVMQCTICNSKGEIHDKEFEKYMIRNLMSILILTLCLSHCALTTTDMINIGAGIYGGFEHE